ncbi:MAG: hypothetical protein E7379_02250 [Clostridiales bacterium]|nr:hypothetical protein [Clostridiales bacterium]
MQKMFRSKLSMITYILSFCFLFVGTSLVFASLPIKAEEVEMMNVDSELVLSWEDENGVQQEYSLGYNAADGLPEKLDSAISPYIPQHHALLGWYDESLTTKYYLSNGDKVEESEANIKVFANAAKTDNNMTLYANVVPLWTNFAVKPTGTGTRANPYKIETAQHLAWVAQETNSGRETFAGKYLEGNSRIDLADYYWEPIGTVDHPFQGNITYYSSVTRREISNIKICSLNNVTYYGLFGYCGNQAYLDRMDVLNVEINIENATSEYCIGSLAGKVLRAPYACQTSNVEIEVSTYDDGGNGACIGGLFGDSSVGGTIFIDSSYINITITGYGAVCVGGVVGKIPSHDTNYNANDFLNINIQITSEDINVLNNRNYYVGGIVGQCESIDDVQASDIEISFNYTKSITNATLTQDNKQNLFIGGLVGNGSAVNCTMKNSNISFTSNETFIDIDLQTYSLDACVVLGGLSGQNNYQCKFQSCLVSDSKVYINRNIYSENITGQYHNTTYSPDSSVGGIVGDVYWGEIDGSILNKCVIEVIHTETAIASTYGAQGEVLCGGMVGDTFFMPICSNNQVLSSEIVVSAPECKLGGICSEGAGRKGSTINNCFVKDSVLKAVDGRASVGGIVGYDGSAENCKVENCKIYVGLEKSFRYAGGIVGETLFHGYAEGCQIQDVFIQGFYTGGIAGSVQDYSISKCIVSNCETSGGFVGYASSNLTISDCLYVLGDSSPDKLINSFYLVDGEEIVLQHIVYRINSTASKNVATVATNAMKNIQTLKCLIFENNSPSGWESLYYTGSGDWESSSIKIVNDKPLPACFWIAAGGEDVTTAKLANLGYQVYSA